MALSLGSRLRNAWNIFRNREPPLGPWTYGAGSSIRPDRPHYSRGNERTIATSVYNRIALDVSSVDIVHVDLDDAGRFTDIRDSSLNQCLTVEANIDQTGRALIQDIVVSMFDEGCVAVIPTDTTANPNETSSYDILELRTAKIVEWYPRRVKLNVYNEQTGQHQEVIVPKKNVAIIENPFYTVMNEPNSVLKRLINKMVLMDRVDNHLGSNKFDLILQMPYTIRNQTKQEAANMRLKNIEDQLANSQYGIAYVDATEKITQLNRPLENNLLKQIEYFTDQFYGQLGITNEILNGTANEATMLNYQSRTIEPLCAAIVDEFNRKFLTKTARTQGQAIMYFKDPFKLVPVSQVAEIADKMTRNEIMTSNEIRQIIGMKPSDDPSADELRNKNLSQSNEDLRAASGGVSEKVDTKAKGQAYVQQFLANKK